MSATSKKDGTWQELDKDVRKSYEEWGIEVPAPKSKSKG